jgi:hypothetical protein
VHNSKGIEYFFKRGREERDGAEERERVRGREGESKRERGVTLVTAR